MPASNIKRIKKLGFPWETQDPFLFCVYHHDEYPEGNEKFGPKVPLDGRNLGQDFTIKDGFRMYHGEVIPGFPAHPHRGFETITVVRKGFVDHSDSLGASGRYGNGDVQWMTAGKGVQHAEMFPLLHKDKDNTLDLFQIWLNLPKKSKMTEPYFNMIWADEVPIVNLTDKNGKNIEIEVFAGKVEGKHAAVEAPDSWAAIEDNEVGVFNIKMEANAQWNIPKAGAGVNRTIYFYEGDMATIDGLKVDNDNLVELNAQENLLLENGPKDAQFLILQGKPLNEPVVQYGPFVMNTQDEIRQAMMDYQQTRFGGWPWPSHDNVHGEYKGRFAIYPDGREERKS